MTLKSFVCNTCKFIFDHPEVTTVVTLGALTCYQIGKIAGLIERNY